MAEGPSGGAGRLELLPEGFAAVERLVAYEMGNALLTLNVELQQRFGLRAEEYQVFMLVVLATVQRFVRDGGADATLLRKAPLPPEQAGHVSRRRISEALGIPLETVRRIVARLLDRGMIVERHRGRLSTAGGTLQVLASDGTPDRVARRFLATANRMLALGAARAT